MGSAMGCAQARTGKEDYSDEKMPPERLQRGERSSFEIERACLKNKKKEKRTNMVEKKGK